MAIFKCKICGGTLEIDSTKSVATCEYCGTKQTLPKLDDDRKANLYDRANHFRRNNDFDKAMGIYENILNEDNTDSEAYWSIVLCRYGIEYVEDPSSHKRVPTVNRAQFTSIFDDEDYKSAIANADEYQREIYESEANAINEIQFGYVERPTHRSRLYDKERFEVCNHRYTALRDGSHGASVMNDCKYGISVNGNSMELTLLRSGACPDLRTDNRVHNFTYAFTAWEGDFTSSDVVKQAYEVNIKPTVLQGGKLDASYLSVDNDNIIIDTVKLAEDGSGDIIVRLYESKKAAVSTKLHAAFTKDFKAYACDMLENVEGELAVDNGAIDLTFKAFEIKTVRLSK